MRFATVTIAVLSLCIIISIPVVAADKPATSTKTYPRRLSNKELNELSELVCRKYDTSHDKINGWTDKPGDKNLQAAVSCQPHTTTERYAIFRAAVCQRGEKWQCTRSETWLRTTVDNKSLEIDTNGYQPEIAYTLVSKIAKYRNIKGDLVFEHDTKQCSLSKGPSKELLDITCDGKLFRLSYWCPQSSCPRVFSINGYFVPANGGGL